MILLDTHIWFYFINDGPEKLPAEAHKAIRDNDVLGVSIISCWEIASSLKLGAPLVTLDLSIKKWGHVQTIS